MQLANAVIVRVLVHQVVKAVHQAAYDFLAADPLVMRFHDSSSHRSDQARRQLGAAARFLDVGAIGQRHAHAATHEAFRLAEQADVALRHHQRLRHALEGDAFFVHAAVDHRRRPRLAQAHIHRQAENRARVQLEFGLALAAHGHHAGIVRARADFGEPHLIALDEQFHAENAAPAEIVGDGLGNLAAPFSGLPALIACGCQLST